MSLFGFDQSVSLLRLKPQTVFDSNSDFGSVLQLSTSGCRQTPSGVGVLALHELCGVSLSSSGIWMSQTVSSSPLGKNNYGLSVVGAAAAGHGANCSKSNAIER